VKKSGAITLIVLVLVILLWLYYYTRNSQQTTTVNNSSITNQSATVPGSNNIVIQAAPGANVISGLSDEGLKQIRDGMLAIQKQKDAELRAEFNVGYILFTATERNEIVPLDSPMNDILEVDWKSGYNISFSDNIVKLRLPKIILHPPNSGIININSGYTIAFSRDGKNNTNYFVATGNYGLVFKFVSANDNSIIIAMGIKSPP
jgi:hypothetical protein